MQAPLDKNILSAQQFSQTQSPQVFEQFLTDLEVLEFSQNKLPERLLPASLLLI